MSTHLKRVCLRTESDSEVRNALATAKDTLQCIAEKGTSIQFSDIKPLKSLWETVSFVEGRGFLVVNKPSFESHDKPLTCEGPAQEQTGSLEPCSMPLVEPDSPMADTPGNLQPAGGLEEDPCPEPEHTGRFSDHIADEEIVDGSARRIQARQWKNQKRLATQTAGLYKRHSMDHPILKGFHSYLSVTLGVPDCQQEVSNLARFLFFINPKALTLEYVTMPSRVNEYFEMLRSLRLSSQSSLRILKHIRRFTTYQMRGTTLSTQEPQLYRACEVFMEFTMDLQKSLYRGVCRESVGKRYETLMEPSKTPKDCQRILEKAKPRFQACLAAVQDGGSDLERSEILLYLQALLILRNLQRPGVVRNMTVSEWDRRTHHLYSGNRMTIVGVKTHKCASTQVASFVLSEEEESWFEVYATYVRPALTTDRQTISNFFVTTTGKVVVNPSNALKQYHDRYKLPNITSQIVRRVCETWTMSRYSDSEKHLFARYLAHKNDMAERVYREKTLTDMCHAHELVVNSGKD
ncbi:uncharacterized protein LOC143815944 isoform X1 [Ranitomeya variabilis]|uniref:uncharacterized protein LOC143815944 isoform X1 n=1 Tax=Ranitomeya variabilis TaxID=490064 RepID=UPI004055D082